MTIEVKCPRCEMLLRVPDRKAGRRGRCAFCGGAVKVPLLDEVPTPLQPPMIKHSRARMIWAASAAVVLLTVMTLVLVLGHRHRPGEEAEQNGPTLTPEQKARLEAQLAEVDKLENEVRRYRDQRLAERRLRARDLLDRMNRYEPLSDFEYALREQVVEAQSKTAKGGGERDDWKLNTPLSASEKADLGRLSDDMQVQAANLARELSAIGVFMTLEKDPLGRALLDPDKVAASLSARKERLVKEAGEPPQ